VGSVLLPCRAAFPGVIPSLLQSLGKEQVLNPAKLGTELEHTVWWLFLLPFGTVCTLWREMSAEK